MAAGDEEVLIAGPKGRSINELEVFCEKETYEARINLLRNLVVASYPSGESAVRLSGSLTGRSYKARFAAEDGCALPIAVFLLWHIVTNRRRAYRMRSPRRGGVVQSSL